MRLFSFLVLVFFSVALAAQPNVIPAPVEYKAAKGSFSLRGKTPVFIVANQKEAQAAAGFLQNAVQPGGKKLTITQAEKPAQHSIVLTLSKKTIPVIGNEGYTLEVTPLVIRVSANTGAGLFYGVQTLSQLVENDRIGACSINDYPRFGWRGLMLDVSRHFFTKEEVKQYIDQMARYKFNTFHWHLTDDEGWRVEIKSLPKLTSVGACRVPRTGRWGEREAPRDGEAATNCGFYTQDDVREIVKYAAERHVTIVPEIDVPGHSMAAVAAYPELSCTHDPKAKVNPGSKFAEWYDHGFKMLIDNTLNPSNEEVYVFLDKVFSELATLFPNPYIHIGGDECYKGYWEQDPGCQALMKKEGMKEVHELQSYFNKRLEKILQAKGRKLLGWDEILEGGLAPSATVMSWRGMAGGIEAARQGHEVVMTPTTFAYIDYMQGDPTLETPIYSWLTLKKCYSFEPVPDGVNAKLVLGGQANLWSEKIPNLKTAQYMSYPRSLAIAEVLWTPKSGKNWGDFVRRTENEFKRFDAKGESYSKAIYDPVVWPTVKDGQLSVDLYNEFPGQEMYYTLDNTTVTNGSTKYTSSFVVPEGPITLRVTSYRNGLPSGRTIILTREQLVERADQMTNFSADFEK